MLAEETPRRPARNLLRFQPQWHLQGGLAAVPSPASVEQSINHRLIQAIVHQSGNRVRFRIHDDRHHDSSYHRRLIQLLHARPEVDRVRINALAATCVVEFNPNHSANPSATQLASWIESLPATDEELERLTDPLIHQAPQGSLAGGESAEAGDEPFVPSRIVLPVGSLALALLAGPLALPPLAVAGFILVAAHLSFKRAWVGLRDERKINVDFLDALAVALHSLEGFLVGPALMISMIEGGEAVRDATQRIAHSANTDLLASLQTDVRRIGADGQEEVIPSDSLQAGDRVLFFPGDSIPIDGVIETGEGSFDVVKLTGESVPRHGAPGDEVLAGFILLEGSLVVETLAVGGATRIGQITAMIESAPVYDTRVGNYASKIANRFVMPTLLLAGVSLLLSSGNIAQAASLLMFDLGTGLRVSVPTAIMAALTRAGSQGLLIRSGRALEQLVDIDVVVFDKTGTLTQGHPSVVHLDVLNPNISPDRLVWLAATAEQGLNHPVAGAIIQYAESQGQRPGTCEAWDYRIGKGVCATIDGHQILIGNARALADEAVVAPQLNNRPELDASTPIYLAVDGVVAAIFYAADELRPDSRQLVAELHRRGIQAHMLTGDVSHVAHAVAKRLGLNPDEVHAEALPDQKAELVKQLTEQGHKVAFVGDGINDSAALAYADVSVSFASGSDLARETADIVLTNDKVSGLLVAQDLARRTFALVKQNIGIVGVPNLSALVIGTFVPVSPIAAVLLNNGSCLVAAGNAMRTLGFKPNELPDLSPAEKSVAQEDLALTTNQLAQRLGTSHQTVSARRRRGDLGDWSQQRDPQNQAWFYCESRGAYRILQAAAVA